MFYRKHDRVTKNFENPSLTKQSFKDECDINNVLKNYERNGVVTHVSNKRPHYGDFTGVEDYQSAMNKIIAVEDAFYQLPAAARKRFDNNPAAFLDFCSNPENIDELRSLGLAIEQPAEPQIAQAGGTPRETPKGTSGDTEGTSE